MQNVDRRPVRPRRATACASRTAASSRAFDDPKISAVLFRSQEISRYVVDGIVDCGLTGYDWVVENGNENDVVEICELDVLAAPAPTPSAGCWPCRTRATIQQAEDLRRQDHRDRAGEHDPPLLRSSRA